jgi:ribosomal protein L9
MLARPTISCFGFTRAYKKIVLTKDVDNLGFTGEICFVKPGYALNNLVPKRQALFFTDPKAQMFLTKVNVSNKSPLLSTCSSKL